MAIKMAALFSIASNVMSMFFNLKDATAGYALAVARDTQTNGLTA